MKIYPRILFNTLPLIFVGILFVGSLTYYLSRNALSNLAEKWLATKLADATRVASENVAVLQKYGLQNVPANVAKAQAHAAEAIARISLGDSGYVWVVDAQGIVVVHPEAEEIGKTVHDNEWFQYISGNLNGKCYHWGRRGKMLAAYKYFSPWRWYVLASAPEKELYGEAHRMRTYIWVTGLAAMVVTALVSMVLARLFTAPLNTLAKEAQRIGKGDHREVARLERNDEIGTLSAAFNTMTRQLGRRIAQEQLISDIARPFIHLSAAKTIDRAILAALQKIGEYTHADRSYVGQFSLEEHLVAQTHEWCRQGVEPQVDNMTGLSLDELPWLMRRLEEDGYLLAPDIEQLPDEASSEKRLWQARGLESVMRVAITYGGQLRGFVGIDARRCQAWTLQDVALLKRTAELFYNALERQWYQDKLAAEKERLSVTLQSIADGVITTDVEGRVVLINPVGEQFTGWRQSEAAGQPIEDVFIVQDENSRRRISNPISTTARSPKGGTAVGGQSILISRNGDERLIASSAAPIFDRDQNSMGVVLVFRDITDKRRMQEELLRVEKLESIGVLAGGIAHDFNNILTAIIGNIALTKRHAAPESKVEAKLSEIEKASFRARDLTQQLLTFSKGGEPVKKTLLLDQLFYDSAMFALGGSNVSLDFSRPEALWPVEADEGQLSQVVNNLVLNAVQAMLEGGVLYAAMENVMISSASAMPLADGRYVKITLQDSGVGIDKQNLGRIFDPFFTTKENGSGLGLATCYAIVEKHGGHITADSKPGQGTVFTLFFPATEKEICELPPLHQEIPKGSGNILVMDDERIIRDLLGDLLTAIGYQVAFARDGREMLDLYISAKNNGHTFDAVIMDLTIPGGMGGKEAIGRLLEADAAAKAIVSSGYSTDPVMSNFARYGFRAAVSKPYRIEELCNTLNQILPAGKK